MRHAEVPAGAPAAAGDARSALDELAREEVSARLSLTRERQDALDRQRRLTEWLALFGAGPAAIVAIVLAMIADRPELIWPFLGLGAAVQLWRIWKEHRRIGRLTRELQDPIDGS